MIYDAFCRAVGCENYYVYIPDSPDVEYSSIFTTVSNLSCSSCALQKRSFGIQSVPEECPFKDDIKVWVVKQRMLYGAEVNQTAALVEELQKMADEYNKSLTTTLDINIALVQVGNKMIQNRVEQIKVPNEPLQSKTNTGATEGPKD